MHANNSVDEISIQVTQAIDSVSALVQEVHRLRKHFFIENTAQRIAQVSTTRTQLNQLQFTLDSSPALMRQYLVISLVESLLLSMDYCVNANIEALLKPELLKDMTLCWDGLQRSKVTLHITHDPVELLANFISLALESVHKGTQLILEPRGIFLGHVNTLNARIEKLQESVDTLSHDPVHRKPFTAALQLQHTILDTLHQYHAETYRDYLQRTVRQLHRNAISCMDSGDVSGAKIAFESWTQYMQEAKQRGFI